jgi:hypothetical protein
MLLPFRSVPRRMAVVSVISDHIGEDNMVTDRQQSSIRQKEMPLLVSSPRSVSHHEPGKVFHLTVKGLSLT